MKRKISVLSLGIILIFSPNFMALQDTEPPIITDVEVNPEIQISGGFVNITCGVSDNVEVNIVKVNITYPDNSTYNITMQKMPVSPHYVPSHFYNSSYTMLGIYKFYIWANDTSGNSNISSLYTFNITNDVTPPETYILNGPSGTIYYNDVTFEWTGTDDYTPTSNLLYSYKLEGYDVSWSGWTNETTKTYLNLPNGSYNFMVRAKDEAGNIDPTPANRSFKVKTDTTPPVISDVEDFPDPQIVGGYVNITCTVTDDFEVNEVKVIIKYPDATKINVSMSKIGRNTYFKNMSYTLPGIYHYYIWANDTSSNSAKSSTYTFEIEEDTNPPAVIIERPKRFLYIADRPIIPTLIKPVIFGRITIKVFATDYESEIEKVQIYIDGRLKHTAREPPYIWMWNERAFGNHIITATAYDKAGNRNEQFLEVFIMNL